MNLAFATRDISKYKSALYQRDVLSELSKRHAVTPVQEPVDMVNAAADAEILILGHEWLDSDGNAPFEIRRMSDNIPTIMILNKEYGALDKKLKYFHQIGARGLVTHHHDLKSLSSFAPAPEVLHWMPFAANDSLFHGSVEPDSKLYDLNFSGVLRNPTFPQTQSDWRERVHRELFYTAKDFILTRRNASKVGRLRWVPITGNWWRDTWNRLRLGRFIQSNENYAKALRMSRFTLCTLSPLGLVGTRFFEAALSGSGILVPVDQDLQGLFPETALFRFSSIPDLIGHLESAQERSSEYIAKVQLAQELAIQKHTWGARIKSLIDFSSSFLN